jgi:hypothetical protein
LWRISQLCLILFLRFLCHAIMRQLCFWNRRKNIGQGIFHECLIHVRAPSSTYLGRKSVQVRHG